MDACHTMLVSAHLARGRRLSGICWMRTYSYRDGASALANAEKRLRLQLRPSITKYTYPIYWAARPLLSPYAHRDQGAMSACAGFYGRSGRHHYRQLPGLSLIGSSVSVCTTKGSMLAQTESAAASTSTSAATSRLLRITTPLDGGTIVPSSPVAPRDGWFSRGRPSSVHV